MGIWGTKIMKLTFLVSEIVKFWKVREICKFAYQKPLN